MSSTISDRSKQKSRSLKAVAIVGFVGIFVGIMVYAWLTMADAGKSGADIFPGIFHPVEFALVIVGAFSVLIIGYAGASSIVLKNGFTRSSTVKFLAITCVTAAVWTFQAYFGDFDVSEGYAGVPGYRVVYLTLLQPHSVVRAFLGSNYWWEWLPEFLAIVAVLLALGGVFAFFRRGAAFETRRVLVIRVAYVALLASGLAAPMNGEDAWTVIDTRVLVGAWVGAFALVLESLYALAKSARGNPSRAGNDYRNRLLIGLCAATGFFLGGVLAHQAFIGLRLASAIDPRILPFVSVATVTSLATALTVQALTKYQEPDVIAGVLLPPLPTRPVRTRL